MSAVLEKPYVGRWWHLLDDGRLQCDLCPRDCRLHEGQRGACFVRMREHDRMVLTTYGRSSGFCIDPVEKKPLNHFYPGSSILSFSSARTGTSPSRATSTPSPTARVPSGSRAPRSSWAAGASPSPTTIR